MCSAAKESIVGQPDQRNPAETAALRTIWKDDSSVLVPTKPPIRMVRLCFTAALFYGILSIFNSLVGLPYPKETQMLAGLPYPKDTGSTRQTATTAHTAGAIRESKKNDLKTCMIASVVEDDAAAGPLERPVVDLFRGIPSADYRHEAQKSNFQFFLVSDISPEKRPKGWTLLDQPLLENSSIETLERYVQYLPQKHETLAKECDVAFFVSYLESVVPRAATTVFTKLAERIHESEHGLALHQFKGETLQSISDRLIEEDPPSRVELELTLELFDKEESLSAPVFNTSFVGMDLNNPLLQDAALDFWKLYQTENLTAYDNILYSHIIHKHGLKPLTDIEPLDTLMNLKERGMASGGNRMGRLFTPLSEGQQTQAQSSNEQNTTEKIVPNKAKPTRRRRRRRPQRKRKTAATP